MRKTQKYVIVALHVSDLEHVCGGRRGSGAKERLIVIMSWLVRQDSVLYLTPVPRDPWSCTCTTVCDLFAPRVRLVRLPPRGEGLEVDGELAVIVVVCARAHLALDLLHGNRHLQRLDDQRQFVRVERAGAVLIGRFERLANQLRVA